MQHLEIVLRRKNTKKQNSDRERTAWISTDRGQRDFTSDPLPSLEQISLDEEQMDIILYKVQKQATP